MSKHIQDELLELRRDVEQHLKLARIELKKMESLSPFSESIDEQIV